ncbi:MAG: hypothetical protein ACRD1M_06145 [Terriglobales bacterium]
MTKRVLNSGLWLGAAVVLAMALMQPPLADCTCGGAPCQDSLGAIGTCETLTAGGMSQVHPDFWCVCVTTNGILGFGCAPVQQ